MRLYLDAAPVIYAVEQFDGFAATVDERLDKPDVVLIASDLTRVECRVKPLREGDTELLQDYDGFFTQTVAEMIALSREVIDRATGIRADYGFKTPDSIHLAAALEAACNMFLTNDHHLDRFNEIAIEVV